MVRSEASSFQLSTILARDTQCAATAPDPGPARRRTGDVAFEQPIAVLPECHRNPDAVIDAQPHKPAKQQVSFIALGSSCATMARDRLLGGPPPGYVRTMRSSRTN